MEQDGAAVRVAVLVALVMAQALTGAATPADDGAVYAQGKDGVVSVGNRFIGLNFRPQDGSLMSVVHHRSGVHLKAETVPSAVLGFSLYTKDGRHLYMDTRRATKFTHRWSGTAQRPSPTARVRLRLRWEQFQIEGENYPATAQVTVEVRADSPLTRWRAELKNGGEAACEWIALPLISGVQTLGSSGDDDWLVVPDQLGRAFRSPVQMLPWWGQRYPSGFLNMQFMAFYDGSAGFFFAAYDDSGQTKFFSWDGKTNPGSVILSCAHHFPLRFGGGVKLRYEVVVGAFDGDWHNAADLYKEWARKQSWCRAILRQKTPAWLMHTPVSSLLIRSHPQVRPLSECVAVARDHQRYFGLPLLIWLWDWERPTGFVQSRWGQVDYFPPDEGWDAFNRTVESLHSSQIRLMVYVTAWTCALPSQVWRTEEAKKSAMGDEQGAPRIICKETPCPQAVMCPAAQWWQQRLKELAVTLASRRVDVVQLDGFPWTGPQPCFAKGHGHPPGVGGNWWSQAMLNLLTDIRASCRPAYPDVALSGEGGAELFLPYLDVYHDRDIYAEVFDGQVRSGKAQVVPLFSYVYHPHLIFLANYTESPAVHLGDVEYNRLALARAFVWGELPNYNLGDSFNSPNLDRKAAEFLKNAALARHDCARDFLVLGEALPPLLFDSPTLTLTKAGARVTTPAVLHSVWRAADGATGVVFANISDAPMRLRLNLSAGQLRLSPNKSYAIGWVGTNGLQVVQSRTRLPVDVPIEVAALDVKVLVVNPVITFASPEQPPQESNLVRQGNALTFRVPKEWGEQRR